MMLKKLSPSVNRLAQAIVRTIIYADIFEYPLTIDEIWKWLIKIKTKNEKIKTTIKELENIKRIENYYFIAGREEIVSLRKKRKRWSEEKLRIAKGRAFLLKLIPTVKLVGATGALAVANAKRDDDIDLLIVTSSGLLWTTRLLTTIAVELTGRRRHPGETNVNNKICLNMFVDEDHLSVPEEDRDLFSAHEVVQVKPLWERDDTYRKFLEANRWVKEYLPNGVTKEIRKLENKKLRNKNSFQNKFINFLISQFLNILENLFKKFQLWYMNKRRTSEIISDGIIRFHPKDAREWVLKEYRRRISNLMHLFRRISIAESS